MSFWIFYIQIMASSTFFRVSIETVNTGHVIPTRKIYREQHQTSCFKNSSQKQYCYLFLPLYHNYIEYKALYIDLCILAQCFYCHHSVYNYECKSNIFFQKNYKASHALRQKIVADYQFVTALNHTVWIERYVYQVSKPQGDTKLHPMKSYNFSNYSNKRGKWLTDCRTR